MSIEFDLSSPSGWTKLNDHLATRSYMKGFEFSAADEQVLGQLTHLPDPTETPHVHRWHQHIVALTKRGMSRIVVSSTLKRIQPTTKTALTQQQQSASVLKPSATAATTSSNNSTLSITDRLTSLEKAQQYQATKAAIQAVEANYLTKLRALAQKAPTSVASKAKTERLRMENEAIQAKINKAEYRISHMVASMEQLYTENKKLKQGSKE